MALWQGAEGQNTCKLQCNVAVKCSVHVLGSQKSSKFSTTWRPSGDYIHLKGSWFKKENNLSMYNIRKYYTNLHKTFTKFLRTCQIYILSDPILDLTNFWSDLSHPEELNSSGRRLLSALGNRKFPRIFRFCRENCGFWGVRYHIVWVIDLTDLQFRKRRSWMILRKWMPF